MLESLQTAYNKILASLPIVQRTIVECYVLKVTTDVKTCGERKVPEHVKRKFEESISGLNEGQQQIVNYYIDEAEKDAKKAGSIDYDEQERDLRWRIQQNEALPPLCGW